MRAHYDFSKMKGRKNPYTGIVNKRIGEKYEEVRKKLIGGDKKKEARIQAEVSKLKRLERLVESREKKGA